MRPARRWIAALPKGDLAAWVGIPLVAAALVFTGLQFRQSTRQSDQTQQALEQTENALVSSTSAAIYQEEREVNELVTVRLWPYFREDEPLPKDDPDLSRQAYRVASAMLDHFEHVRFQDDLGAFNAEGWAAGIVHTFEDSPVLCDVYQDGRDVWGDGLVNRYPIAEACGWK